MIEVHGIGKRFTMGARVQPSKSVRESLVRAGGRLLDHARTLLRGGAPGGGSKAFWALKDVSFEVASGEVVGIIGANGAGKSTLLKILSRITDPTEGEARIRGRVGALLEVGTGFHSELTGRENVYLSGAILGMRRAEIRRKFDEIVEFAELSKFIDTPVKRYSSGMTVRLGFAVAAHLEPEVLIVDEILAVGDAGFRRKSVAKMLQVATGGRTVLIVSHSMDLVRRIASRCVRLSQGRIVADGATSVVVDAYVRAADSSGGGDSFENDTMRNTGRAARVIGASVLSQANELVTVLSTGEPAILRFHCVVTAPVSGLSLTIDVYTATGTPVYQLRTSDQGIVLPSTPCSLQVDLLLPVVRLFPNLYLVRAYLVDEAGTCHSLVDPAQSIEVVPGTAPSYAGTLDARWGSVIEDVSWCVREAPG